MSQQKYPTLVEEQQEEIERLEAELAAAKEQMGRMAEKVHYPDCWDTAAYPTLADAVCEIAHCDPQQCQQNGATICEACMTGDDTAKQIAAWNTRHANAGHDISEERG